ncbi:MAG: ABC transporter ATP-binding protein [Desulfobacterales bacterium]|jgi:branched-chain amino acid transport system ATP-binding protein
MMLEVKDIHTYYGLSHILFDVSLKVERGQVVCLLGRNGAGKTTTFRSIMGLNPPSRGQIHLNDKDITGTPPYKLVRQGMGWVPDDRRIFADLTVGENLEIAERKSMTSDQWDKQKVYDLFPALKEMDNRKGGLLSGGEQKMLAIGRALMTNPQFLLLDEPTEGLAPVLVKTLGERIRRLKEVGLTVLLAEQNVKFTLTLSDYGYIIDNGRICYQGRVEELVDNEEVKHICGI